MLSWQGIATAAVTGVVSPNTTGSLVGTQLLAAALAGGVSWGGTGSVIGASIGVVFIGIIRNGLILSRINDYWIEAITGLIILAALVLSGYSSLRAERARKELK